MSVEKVERSVFYKMTQEEQEQYLTQLYHGAQEHLLLARIQFASPEQMAIKPMFFLEEDGTATPAEFFENVTPSELIAKREDSGRIEDFAAFCQARDLQKGQRVICELATLPNHEDQRDFTFDPYSIDRHRLMDVGNLYKKYHWEGYEEFCAAYQQTEANGRVKLLLDDVERKCHTKIDLYDTVLKAKQAELETLENKLQQKKDEGEARVNEEINAYRAKFDHVKAKVDAQIAAEKERVDVEVGAYQAKLEEKGKRYEKILQIFHVLPTNGKKKAKIETLAPVPFNTFEERVRYVQEFLCYHEENGEALGLRYDKDTLAQFYLALQTRQLILFVGKSGTGKSSLVTHFPEAFGFPQAAIIPVQSNWNDKGDLLGYYNPIDKTYVATAFLDRLLQYVELAQQEEHKQDLFFICLDEMNLAHVEYYFAEFLSELQKPVPEIRLYSDAVKDDIRRELQYNGFTRDDMEEPERKLENPEICRMGMEERRYYVELCRKAEMLRRYPATFNIPRNIKFVGTLNQDETTVDLSPKVLDRSFVIRLDHTSARTKIEQPKTGCAAPAKYEPLKGDVTRQKQTAVTQQWEGIKKAIEDETAPVFYSDRVRKNTFEHPDFAAWSKAVGSKAADYLLAMTYLPKLRLDATEYTKEVQAAVNAVCRNHPYTSAVKKAIEHGPADAREIDFWGKW
ncbi:hypothetical protein [uncultured Selenomonas sp.]|uniref:hypothetical protein n=1 Tax=uncultured Selenomonas sp. TaxID=159275 RepID=UPI0025E85AD4|nr:hypothetical protein [uncultured Selenomonas sp.]